MKTVLFDCNIYDKLAIDEKHPDILVSEDGRCRKRLAEISSTCECMSYADFCRWLDALSSNPPSVE